jgi:hypothetical protein
MTRCIAALIAFVVLAPAAFAQTQDCKTIADPALRLTCYDKINPPIATYPIPLPKPSHPIPTTRADGTGYDPQNDQDAQARAEMRNICRGC